MADSEMPTRTPTKSHVDEQQLRLYLDVLHREHVDAVERFIPEEERSRLRRYPLLPSRVIGYVSTSKGAGYEYVDGEPGIETIVHSAPVEEMLFADAPAATRKAGAFIGVRAPRLTINGGAFEGGLPLVLETPDASVTLIGPVVSDRHRGWQCVVKYAELSANREASVWSEPAAIRDAHSEVFVALADIRHSRSLSMNMGDYLAGSRLRRVLVLGDFEHGRHRLEAIRDALQQLGYEPQLLDEIPEQPALDLRQKFVAIASYCRFLVFDDSTPAGQLSELILAEQGRFTTIVLREEEHQASFVTRGISLTSNVMLEREYAPAELQQALTEAAAWAEERIATAEEALRSLYPWRGAAA